MKFISTFRKNQKIMKLNLFLHFFFLILANNYLNLKCYYLSFDI